LGELLFLFLVPEESVDSAQYTVFGQRGSPHIAEEPVELRRPVTEGSVSRGQAL